jgi:hypothetical protein
MKRESIDQDFAAEKNKLALDPQNGNRILKNCARKASEFVYS